MRKNRVLIFLLIIAVVLGFVFYKISNGKEYLTFDKVMEEAIGKCENNQFEDSYSYIDKELKDNPNFETSSKEKDSLKVIQTRIYNIKDILHKNNDEKERIKKIKLFYVKGGKENFKNAETELEESLEKFPTSEELLRLKRILEGEDIVFEDTKSTPPIPKPKPGPVYPIPNPTSDKWVIFKRQERNLLSQGYEIGEGNDEDNIKTLTDPDNEVHSYFKKKKPKNITIDVGLKMNSQNIFTWNELIAKEGLKTTIIIDNGISAPFQRDVTSNSSYIFSPGTAKWDSTPCSVELVITGPERYVIKGIKKIEVSCACKP